MSNIDKIRRLAQHLRVLEGGKDSSEEERLRRKHQAEDQPRDEKGRFIATDPRLQYSRETPDVNGEVNPTEVSYPQSEISLEDIERELGLKKSDSGSIADEIKKQAGHQILEHKKTMPTEDFGSEINLLASYKRNNHHRHATLLKYLIHRIENKDAYNTPSGAKSADQDFLKRVGSALQMSHGQAREFEEQPSIEHLHNFTYKHPHIIKGLLDQQEKLHSYLKQKQENAPSGLSSQQTLKTINGEPHVALNRGLKRGVRKPDPSLASYSDSKESLAGRCEVHHPHWVPLKNVWYSYDFGPHEAHPQRYFPAQDEYLVSPHELKPAMSHEVKKLVPQKPPKMQRKVASEKLGAMASLHKTVQQLESATRNTFAHPTKAVKTATQPTPPKDIPHIRADSQTEINFKLEKGLKGDWQKEGYKLDHKASKSRFFPNKTEIEVKASTSDGKPAGLYIFSFHNDPKQAKLTPDKVHTYGAHQRKGLANAAYKMAEQLSGLKMEVVQGMQSQDAKSLWAQPNKPFGKSAYLPLAKAFKPDAWKKVEDAHYDNGTNAVDFSKHAGLIQPADPEYTKAASNKKIQEPKTGVQGVSPKMVHKNDKNDKIYMTKPYHRMPEAWDEERTKMPIMGWAVAANRALYDAAGIGHLCEKVQAHTHKGVPTLVHPFEQGYTESCNMPYDSKPERLLKKQVLPVQQIAVMDFLTHNADRHGGNIMIHKKTKMPLAIDHERSFQYFDDKIHNPARSLYPLVQMFSSGGMNEVSRILGSDHKPLAQWWNKNKDNIKDTFMKHVAHIKNPDIKNHVIDKFMLRHNMLSDWAKHDKTSSLFNGRDERYEIGADTLGNYNDQLDRFTMNDAPPNDGTDFYNSGGENDTSYSNSTSYGSSSTSDSQIPSMKMEDKPQSRGLPLGLLSQLYPKASDKTAPVKRKMKPAALLRKKPVAKPKKAAVDKKVKKK
jgi:hypothetical protein